MTPDLVHFSAKRYLERISQEAHVLLDLVLDGLDHAGALAHSLRGPQVLTRHLHLLLFKRHHGVLEREN